MQPLIELKNIAFGYGKTPVVKDIDLHIHPGQFAALVGPSGAGKTSLLKLILGTLQPTHGQITMNGATLQGRNKPRIGYVPQLETVDWNFPVTVGQAVLMGRIRNATIWPWPSRAERQLVAEMLDRLDLGGLIDRHIRDLSGGQQQRVFLARALIAEPDILVLDEPTSGVDMRTAENVLHLLADLNQQGMTILITTHDLNAAAAHLPWVICLNCTIIAQGPPEAVFTEAILNQTYQGDMLVMRHEQMIFVHQRPHGHTYHDILPNPVMGHGLTNATAPSVLEEGTILDEIDAMLQAQGVANKEGQNELVRTLPV